MKIVRQLFHQGSLGHVIESTSVTCWSAMRVQGQTFLLIEHIYKRAVFCVFIIFRSVMFRKQVVDGNRFRKDIAIQVSF